MDSTLDRWVVKLLCTIGLFLNQIIFILLPIKVSQWVKSKGEKGALAMSALTCFGGGVFFGAYLMHLQPEVRIMLEDSLLIPQGINFPLSELIAGIGFFFLLFIEKTVLWYQSRSAQKLLDQHGEKQNGHITNGEISNEKSIVKDAVSDSHEYIPGTLKENNSGVNLLRCAFDNNGYSGEFNGGVYVQTDTCHDLVNENEHELKHVNGNGVTRNGDATKNADPDLSANLAMSNPAGSPLAVGAADTASDTSQGEKVGEQAAMARSAIFIFALSLDSVFEGLSMGLKTSSQEVLTLFVAIVSHEFIMSFCIGMELVRYYSRRKMIVVGVGYAFTPVLGAIIGTALVETTEYGGNTTMDVANAVLQAICTGAFIYCTFIGILGQELSGSHGLVKSLMTFVGFAFMAGMAAMPSEPPPEDWSAYNATTLPPLPATTM